LLKLWGLATALVIAGVLLFDDVLGERAADPARSLAILGVRSEARPAEAAPRTDPAAEKAARAAVQFAGFGAGPAAQWRNPGFRQQRPVEVALDGVPVRGSADAPVQILTFSDFLCPSCRNFAAAFEQYARGATGPHVALYYRNYPLDSTCAAHLPRVMHPGACTVALGARCAHRLGRFWEYHDTVYFAPPTNPTQTDVVRIARQAGLDEASFQRCLASPEAAAELQADIAEARRLGVTGTPSIFINGRRLSSLREFADAVLWELEQAGIEVPPGSP